MYDNIIIIPYRKRETHLAYFIENSVPLIEKHLPNTKIVVVEQNEGKLFNRGMVLNVGFKEYQNKTKYFFAHDVDMNPNLEIVQSVYTKEDIEMLRVKFIHNRCLGGIFKVIHDVIFDINGFPNNIWGWGVEDRALYFRCIMKKINIKNNPHQKFKLLPHTKNHHKYKDEKKKISDMWTRNYIEQLNDEQKEDMIMSSGLNNLEYSILERKMIHKIVELIKVDI